MASTPDRRATEEQVRAEEERLLVGASDGALAVGEGIIIDAVELDGSFPSTTIVLVFHFLPEIGYKGCRFRWHSPVWDERDDTLLERDYLWVYLMEDCADKVTAYRNCSPGSTINFGPGWTAK